MKLLKKPIAIIFSLLLLLIIAGAGFASVADQKLAKADKAATLAQTAEKSTERQENYERAIELYTEVQKEYSGKPEGAQALYGMAELKRKRQPGQADKKYYPQLYQAHENLKTLINNYDKPAAEFSEQGLSSSEIEEIQSTVADANTLDTEIRTELDQHNKTTGYSAYLYKMMDFLVNLTGRVPSFSYWFAIALLTIIIKIITTPLTKAQFKAMKEMQAIAPKIKELQEKYKGDQKVIGEKTMELYKEHNINPFASCLPILIQMPILMVLWYTMKAYEFQFLQAKFLWIGSSISHIRDITVPFTGGTVWVTAQNLAEPDLILLVLYLVSMYISTKMSAVDPSQADQQRMMAIMMPLMFGFIFATFPSAFLLYWLLLNILQTTQQYFILKAPMPALAPSTPAAEPPAPADTPRPDGGRSSRRRRRR